MPVYLRYKDDKTFGDVSSDSREEGPAWRKSLNTIRLTVRQPEIQKHYFANEVNLSAVVADRIGSDASEKPFRPDARLATTVVGSVNPESLHDRLFATEGFEEGRATHRLAPIERPIKISLREPYSLATGPVQDDPFPGLSLLGGGDHEDYGLLLDVSLPATFLNDLIAGLQKGHFDTLELQIALYSYEIDSSLLEWHWPRNLFVHERGQRSWLVSVKASRKLVEATGNTAPATQANDRYVTFLRSLCGAMWVLAAAAILNLLR